MGGLEGGDQSLDFRQGTKGAERFIISGVSIFDASLIAIVGVFRADGGVIEAGGDAVGQFDLAVMIGEEVGLGSLEDA